MRELPVVFLSKENLHLMKDQLETCQIGEIMIALCDYLYAGVVPEWDTKVMKGVWNNILSFVERRAEGYFKKIEGNRKGAEIRWSKEKESASTPKPQTTTETTNEIKVPEQAPEQVVVLDPDIQQDDDALFEDFFEDKSMDYSTLLGNIDYFKNRKRSELNNLYKALNGRYSGAQIIQILQEKWTNKINKMELEE